MELTKEFVKSCNKPSILREYYKPHPLPGGRMAGGWSLKHPRGERVKIYCWAELPAAPQPPTKKLSKIDLQCKKKDF